jgi:hypothetical protein
MKSKISAEYVSRLQAAGHPTFQSDNRIVSGRVILTVEPSVGQIDTFQIQVPSNFDLKENLCLPLLLSLVFESDSAWLPVWLRISKSLSATGAFDEIIQKYHVQASSIGPDLVLRFSPDKSS